jgi:hypothetical protein
MSKEKLLKWIEWRYPDVWVDFKRYAGYHRLFDRSKNIHTQTDSVIEVILGDYVESYDLIFTGMDMSKNTKRLFSHINIVLR